MENSKWVYPKYEDYLTVFNRTAKEVKVEYGVCPYCKEHHLLVEDAHKIYSCLECLSLDRYLI